ncbi:DUF6913 domain-containing protein [Bacteroidota bacterium]
MAIPIKEKLFKLINRRVLNRNKMERVNSSFYNAKKIGLLYTWEGDSKKEAVDEFVRVMDLAGKEVYTACFYKSLINIGPQVQDLIFTRKDFKLFGGIKSDELVDFSTQEFDFIFHLDTESNIFIENILARSKACCRVGRYDESRKEYYDFMIDVGSDQKIEILCSEMLKYTKQLVTHD